MNDNVNSPAHYNQGGIECIDAIKAATVDKTPFEAVCVGNVIKYLWRYESKGGLEDVQKAAWYIQRLMQELRDKAMKYQVIGTENGVGLSTPWHTLIVPHEGDMFNPRDEAREHLLGSILNGGGYCPCQPKKDRDTMCPCKNYRMNGKCICGLFVKIPQVVEENHGEEEVERTDGQTTDGQKE